MYSVWQGNSWELVYIAIGKGFWIGNFQENWLIQNTYLTDFLGDNPYTGNNSEYGHFLRSVINQVLMLENHGQEVDHII